LIPSSAVLIVALVQAASAAPVPNSSVASSTEIAVLIPDAATPALREGLSRLRGEAESVGFSIRLLEATTEREPLGQMRQVAAELEPAAVVALVEPPKGTALAAIDVWLLDGTSGKQSVGHLLVENEAGDRAEQVLAVRVVDFIRARMFDSLVRSSEKRKSPPVPPPDVAGKHFVAAGLTATGSFSGFAAAYLPELRIGYGVRPWLRVIAAAAGFGSKPVLENKSGSATVDEKWLLLGADVRTPTWWRLFGVADLGVSALFVSFQSKANVGNIAHARSDREPGLFGALGAGVVLVPHLQLLLSCGGSVLYREPQAMINNVDVGRTGAPAWLASASLAASF
jgi:hypothetical protein